MDACILTLLAIVLAFVSVSACADDLQAIPALAARVTDLTGTLDATQKQTLETELAAVEQRKGAQVAILIVATTKPEEIEAFAIRVFDAWKLGRKNIDDGVLLLVAKDDHRVRIEVARGLEAAIPDAASARIIREYITPRFRAGDFFGGVHDAIGALTKLIDGETLPPPLTRDEAGGRMPSLPNLLFYGLLGALWLRNMFGGLPDAARAGAMGAIGGIVAWFVTSILGLSIGFALFAALIGWLGGARGSFAGGRGGGWASGGLGGGWSGSSGGGGGFSGGGGISAGGGASGSW